MSIVGYVIFNLGSISGYSHSFHSVDYSLVSSNRITTDNDTPSIIFFIDQVIPLALFDLINLISAFRVDIKYIFKHFLGISCEDLWLLVLTHHYLFV